MIDVLGAEEEAIEFLHDNASLVRQIGGVVFTRRELMTCYGNVPCLAPAHWSDGEARRALMLRLDQRVDPLSQDDFRGVAIR